MDNIKFVGKIPLFGRPIISVVETAAAIIKWLQDNTVKILTVICVVVGVIITVFFLLCWCIFWTVVVLGVVHRWVMSGAPESAAVPVNLDLSAGSNGRMGSGVELQEWYERTLFQQDRRAQERWNETSRYLGKNPEVSSLLSEALRARTIGQLFGGSRSQGGYPGSDRQDEWSNRNLFPALMAGGYGSGLAAAGGTPFYSSSLGRGSVFFKRPVLEDEDELGLDQGAGSSWFGRGEGDINDAFLEEDGDLQSADDVFDGYPQKKHQDAGGTRKNRRGARGFSNQFPDQIILPADFEISAETTARYTMSLQIGLADDDHNTNIGPITAVGELFSNAPTATGSKGHSGNGGASQQQRIYRTVARGHSSRRIKQRSWLRKVAWSVVTFWIPNWALTLLVSPTTTSSSMANGGQYHHQLSSGTHKLAAADWSDCYLDFPIFTRLRPNHFLRHQLVGMNISLQASKPVLETLHLDDAWLLVEVELEGFPWWFLHHPVLMHLVLGSIIGGTVFTWSLIGVILVACLVAYLVGGGQQSGSPGSTATQQSRRRAVSHVEDDAGSSASGGSVAVQMNAHGVAVPVLKRSVMDSRNEGPAAAPSGKLPRGHTAKQAKQQSKKNE